MPWGKQLADDLKAADAIVDDAERAPRSRTSTSRSWRSTSRACRSATRRRPSSSVPAWTGVIPSPLTAEEFDTVTVGGE